MGFLLPGSRADSDFKGTLNLIILTSPHLKKSLKGEGLFTNESAVLLIPDLKKMQKCSGNLPHLPRASVLLGGK